MALFRRKPEEVAERPREGTGERPGGGFLPNRERRPRAESVFVRLIATGGIIGLGTAVAAILGSQDVATWIVGIVVATLSVLLAAILWSSRRL
jgi:hypothetical protein